MCDAMNRDIMNVLFGGMNVAAPAAAGDAEPKVHVETNMEATANALAGASKVLIVPGYGIISFQGLDRAGIRYYYSKVVLIVPGYGITMLKAGLFIYI